MRFSTVTTLLFGGIASAQLGSDMPITCQNGQAPILTCGNPASEMCGCTCRDGMTFNQPRPSPPGNTTPPPMPADPMPPPPPPPRADPEPYKFASKPCLGRIINDWKAIEGYHKPNSLDNGELATDTIDIPEDAVLIVTDRNLRCEIFEVSVDNKVLGETYGTAPLDNKGCGNADDCMNKNGGAHGFFFVPKGLRLILEIFRAPHDRYQMGQGPTGMQALYGWFFALPDTRNVLGGPTLNLSMAESTKLPVEVG
ncbi:hypothetical protein COCMIDRAFT_22842 [Bipolaris oryzae ATCC 44560]|uniref:Uncharacterized protein n=1 Tax=Bipolaris oryzae ATCC 44560 TaxID=930090 RepID=W6ZPQ8_COCMI|nr:uncharacterized protein COCMIDRAFT_22842 [Bipolaris oryzae ATCC 44560]EUC49464.1 hypothetical protein COCMIDRAFT_22842 [Bipolaris oryzae ATCC 44560]